MKKYLQNYIHSLEEILKDQTPITGQEKTELTQKIQFFQHERLIHLLVTIAFAFFTLFFLILGTLSYLFLIPFFFLIILLIFYIFHYFFLENSVQYLYKLRDHLLAQNPTNPFVKKK